MRAGASILRHPSIPAAGLTSAELAIARSVVYASLFDYPLTLAQLRQTLIESIQTPSQVLAAYNGSAALQDAIEFRDGFFFPKGRADLVDERRRRETRSRAFLHRNRRLLQLVCALPYVRMVALSGSIAHLNLEGSGDLDLFIVTRGRRVWSTTVAVLVLAKLLRRRRIVCANFVVADTRLVLEQQDLFAASQVIHLKPLLGRDVFLQLLERNPFLFRFYPNFHAADAAIAAVPPEPRARLAAEDPGNRARAGLTAGGVDVPGRVPRVSAPARSHLALARAGPPAGRLPQAPHPEPSPIGPRALRPKRPVDD